MDTLGLVLHSRAKASLFGRIDKSLSIQPRIICLHIIL